MRAELYLPAAGATEALGGCLAAALRPGLQIHLHGNLGTGKTTLIRGLLRGLGHQGSVRSPTYTLIEPYEVGGRRLAHLDLYRLGDPEELEFLGLRDLLDGETLCLIEWPERGAGVLAGADLRLDLAYRPPGRALTLIAETPSGISALGELVQASCFKNLQRNSVI